MLRNATVLTMDQAHLPADAVAIAGDTIVAVGTEAEVMAASAPNPTIVDIGGRVLMTMVGGRVEYCAPDAGTLRSLVAWGMS